jgi:threonine/homoserine/homoserine lactone efflux protein
MDVAALAVFTVSFALAAASPGPGMAALVARALGSGLRGAIPFAAGMVIGDLVWLSVAALGLAAVATTFQALFTVIKYAGIAYLVFLAFRLWTAPATGEEIRAVSAERPLRVVAGGLALTLGNPKTMIFYLAILPAVVDLGAVDALSFAELGGIIVVVLSAVCMAYAWAAARARTALASPAARRVLNRVAGTAMVGAAAAIAAR